MEGKANHDNFDQCISTYIICYAQVDNSVFTDVVKKITEMYDKIRIILYWMSVSAFIYK